MEFPQDVFKLIVSYCDDGKEKEARLNKKAVVATINHIGNFRLLRQVHWDNITGTEEVNTLPLVTTYLRIITALSEDLFIYKREYYWKMRSNVMNMARCDYTV